MSKLEVKQEHAEVGEDLTQIENIPMGEVFFGTIEDRPSVFMRIWSRIVDLKRVNRTWPLDSGVTVENYRPAQRAVLTVS